MHFLVTTVVQQQKQLTSLQSTMKQMVEDHAKSQEALVAWTSQCVQELLTQNANLESRLQEARQQIKNFSYNMQGYVDNEEIVPPKIEINIQPPAIYKTVTPKGMLISAQKSVYNIIRLVDCSDIH